jgi:hypothetical protein
LYCFGADFYSYDPLDLSSLYATNQFFFSNVFAADPSVDYTNWDNLRRARFLEAFIDLSDYAGAGKELALVFGFNVPYSINGRVLVYLDGGLLHDQTLAVGDNQFMLLIESIDQPLNLYFVHVGGSWFFKGLSGYVV